MPTIELSNPQFSEPQQPPNLFFFVCTTTAVHLPRSQGKTAYNVPHYLSCKKTLSSVEMSTFLAIARQTYVLSDSRTIILRYQLLGDVRRLAYMLRFHIKKKNFILNIYVVSLLTRGNQSAEEHCLYTTRASTYGHAYGPPRVPRRTILVVVARGRHTPPLFMPVRHQNPK